EAATVLDAHIGPYSAEDGLTALSVGGEKLLIPGKLGNVGDQDRVRIAATDVSLAIDHPSRTTILNIIPVRVKDVDHRRAAELVGDEEASGIRAVGRDDACGSRAHPKSVGRHAAEDDAVHLREVERDRREPGTVDRGDTVLREELPQNRSVLIGN